MIKPLTLSQRLLERADASDEDCRTDDGDIMREADEAMKAKDAEIALLREARQMARSQAIDDTLAALTAHELYQYRPKAFRGFIEYAKTLKDEANAQLWRAAPEEKANA